MEGYEYGYNQGALGGYDDGYDEGFNNGKSEGYTLGYKGGFEEGVIKGQTNDPYDLGDFIFSIIDAPFLVIRESLNFEILGYNISDLVLFVITAFLVIFVVKKLKGD